MPCPPSLMINRVRINLSNLLYTPTTNRPPPWSSGSVLDHRSLPPVFESRGGHIRRLFRLWLRLITFGGRSAHLAAYRVHKSGRKISIIIIIIIITVTSTTKTDLRDVAQVVSIWRRPCRRLEQRRLQTQTSCCVCHNVVSSLNIGMWTRVLHHETNKDRRLARNEDFGCANNKTGCAEKKRKPTTVVGLHAGVQY